MPKLPEKDEIYGQPLLEMSVLYREMLVKHIELACIWLLNAPLVTYDAILPSVVFDGLDREDWMWKYTRYPNNSASDRIWYYSITLWYVLRYCPEAFKDPKTRELLHSRMPSLENVDIDFQQDDPKSSILQWYHYGCFLKICKVPGSEGGASVFFDRPKDDGIADQERIWKSKAQKNLKPTGKGRSNRALADYHVTNLALLAEELSANTTGPPSLCLTYAKKFVRNRDGTTVLNPGKEDQKESVHTIVDTTPPWELLSLNHHSMLRPEVGASEERVDAAMDECQEFLLADYTFIGSWNQSNNLMISTWWDMLPSSILGATLLDRRLNLQVNDGPDLNQKVSLMETPREIEMTNANDLGLNQPSSVPGMPERKSTIKVGDDTMDDIIKRLLDGIVRASTKQAEETEEFDWRCRRPQRIYYPDAFTQSLEDTPELFRSKQLKNVSIRSNIKKYLEKKNNGEIVAAPDWSLDTAAQNIKAEELLYLSCWDLSRDGDGGTSIYISSSKGRVDDECQTIPISYSDHDGVVTYPLTNGPSDGIIEGSNTGTSSTLWSFYLNGCPEQHCSFSGLPKPLKDKLRDPTTRNDVLSQYQKSLFSRLNDSVCNCLKKNSIL
jgi:hypothetical protein